MYAHILYAYGLCMYKQCAGRDRTHTLGGSVAVSSLEVPHEVHQQLHLLHSHRVVDRRTHPSNRPVPLELDKPPGLGLLDELGLQGRVIPHPERHVHPRPRPRCHRRPVEAFGRLDGRVQQISLRLVAPCNGFQPALPLHPLEHKPCHVDRICGGGVVHRLVVCCNLVAEHDRGNGKLVTDEIFANNDNGEAGGSQVLLGSSVYHSKARDVNRSGKECRAEVANKRHTVSLGDVWELHTVYCFIGTIVDICSIRVQVPLRSRRDVGVLLGLGKHIVHGAILLGLLSGAQGPVTSDNIVGRSSLLA
eukprot:Colp12_sorted_trinity150504_noHs@12234